MKNQCESCNKHFHTTFTHEDEAAAVSKIIEAIRPLGITFDTAIGLMDATKERLQEMATFLPLDTQQHHNKITFHDYMLDVAERNRMRQGLERAKEACLKQMEADRMSGGAHGT
jgi:hypothetical protein